MKAKLLLGVLLAAAALAASAHASSVGYISILGEDGRVFNLNTSTGVASLAASLTDPPGSAEPQYSPNGLGVVGRTYFYTAYNTTGADALYRNNAPIFSIAATEPYNVANGDAVGSNFYFVDRHTGKFWTIGNIFSSPSTTDVTTAQITGFAGATMGDIAILGNTAYLSYGNPGYLSTFDITNPGGGFAKTVAKDFRFVGLGFDGDKLYGVRRAGTNDFELWSIDQSLKIILVADITGIPTTGGAVTGQYEITDGSRAVPIPAAAWLLGSGLIGLVALRKKLLK